MSVKKSLAAEPRVVVNIAEVKAHGELWEKAQLHFDMPTMDVRAYALLADSPARQLCWNTYNGTLGKQRKRNDLPLTEFAANDQSASHQWHTLKYSLEKARQILQKKGYVQI